MKYNYTLIIPHYNIPKLLRRLLSTVPHREDLQAIVVDDCSTKELDELEKVRKDYDWVEWYTTGTNGGGGKARNIGLDHAKGKYLIFADADDYFNLCFNEVLDKYKDISFDIIYFAVNSLDSTTYWNSYRAENYNRNINIYLKTRDEKLVRHKRDAPWGKFVKKTLVDENNIRYEECSISNDVKFSMYTDYYAADINVDPAAIYCITSREGSVSVSKSEKDLLTCIRVNIEHQVFLNKHHIKKQSKFQYYIASFIPCYCYLNQLKLQGYSHGMKESYILFEKNNIPRSFIRMGMLVYPLYRKIKKLISKN